MRPCWVDALEPDPAAAATFYAALFGWEIEDGLARLDGRRVAGIVEAPPGAPPFWLTSVCVDALEPVLARVANAGGSVLRAPTDQRTAAILDPAGIPLGLREAPGAEVVGEPGAWAMSALHTPDITSAEAFYSTVFGWEAEHGPLVRWRLGGEVIAVMTATESDVPPHWAVNFRVADLDATLARATELGGTVLLGPVEAQGLLNAVIADPQNGVFAVSAT
jgi:predicted enzyme related to lactoylglutathione lyase